MHVAKSSLTHLGAWACACFASPSIATDFMILDEVLRSKFWYTAVPKLPSKKYFFNFDDEFIKKRKKELETYLKEVLQVPRCPRTSYSAAPTPSTLNQP